MISYAQNYEDVTLASVFAGQTEGFYVDVGASDPVVRSVTKLFYDQGWRGVNVEPVERFHRALVETRPRDINLCVALGAQKSTLTFFEFDAEGISTLSAEFAQHFESQGYPCRRRVVDVIPLRDLCAQHCPGAIDFM
jgi:FkbM family methyltransferase